MQSEQPRQDRSAKVLEIIGGRFLILAFAYTCLRAWKLSLTHDEALTYLLYARYPLAQIFGQPGLIPSNNHLLNSALMHLCLRLFGNSELVIRMPALAGHAIYLCGVYALLRMFLKGWMFAAGAALMALNPFLLDFFSCARGYSLALGFSAWGLYFLMRRMRDPFPGDSGLALLAFALASAASYSFINLFLSASAVLLVRESAELRGDRHGALKGILVNYFLPLAAVTLVFWPVCGRNFRFSLTAWPAYTFGGSSGFWNDTVASLIRSEMYGRNYGGTIQLLLKIGIIAVIVHGAVKIYRVGAGLPASMVKQFPQSGTNANPEEVMHSFTGRWLAALLGLFAGAVLISHLQFMLFKVLFPLERTAIFIVPVFTVFALVCWKDAGRTAGAIYAAAAAVMIIHSVSCLNVKYFLYVKYDASTKDMASYVSQLYAPKNPPQGSMKMGISWIFEPSINYYLQKDGMGFIRPVDRSGPDGKYDIYYLYRENRDIIDRYALKVMREYGVSESCLAQP